MYPAAGAAFAGRIAPDASFAGQQGLGVGGGFRHADALHPEISGPPVQMLAVGRSAGDRSVVGGGARNHAEVHNLYTKSLRLIGVVAVIMTAVSMLIIPYVAKIFVGYDAELLELTSHAFRVYGLSFLIMGFNVYGSSFFTALGDGVTSALISFLRTLLFQLAAVILLPMVLRIEGVWLAVTAAELAALVVTVYLFITKDKVFHYRNV